MENQIDSRLAGLHAFSHPRYFYGQLLQVRHFTAEHEYFKGKNWLTNRLILGWGVACGLDVVAAPDDPGSVIVTPGLALDRLGREIVVESPSKPIAIPPIEPGKDSDKKRRHEQKADAGGEQKGGNQVHGDGSQESDEPRGQRHGRCHDADNWVHLVICFKSCETDPEPVMAGGCDAPGPCSYGTVRESYTMPPPRLGRLDPPDIEGHLHRAFRCRPFGYGELAEWVTRRCDPCLDLKTDTCLPLANIRRPEPGAEIKEIDISVRPIIYGLDLLFDLILSHATEPSRGYSGK